MLRGEWLVGMVAGEFCCICVSSVLSKLMLY